jgi:hypothetical protein
MFRFLVDIVSDVVRQATEEFPITPICQVEVEHNEARYYAVRYRQEDQKMKSTYVWSPFDE